MNSGVTATCGVKSGLATVLAEEGAWHRKFPQVNARRDNGGAKHACEAADKTSLFYCTHNGFGPSRGCGGSSCNSSLSSVCANASSGSGSGSGSGAGSGAGSGSGNGVSSGPFTIGGNVIGLTGTGLVLEDNGGDDLTINLSGAFTFKLPITGGGNYTVTIKTQPSNQPLPCSVTNG